MQKSTQAVQASNVAIDAKLNERPTVDCEEFVSPGGLEATIGSNKIEATQTESRNIEPFQNNRNSTTVLGSAICVAIPNVNEVQNSLLPFTSFAIEFICGMRFRVCRRYKEFAILDEHLRRRTNLEFNLPPKRFIGNLHPNFVENRRKELEAYLWNLLTVNEVLEDPKFWEFLDVNQWSRTICRIMLETRPNSIAACLAKLYNLLLHNKQLEPWACIGDHRVLSRFLSLMRVQNLRIKVLSGLIIFLVIDNEEVRHSLLDLDVMAHCVNFFGSFTNRFRRPPNFINSTNIEDGTRVGLYIAKELCFRMVEREPKSFVSLLKRKDPMNVILRLLSEALLSAADQAFLSLILWRCVHVDEIRSLLVDPENQGFSILKSLFHSPNCNVNLVYGLIISYILSVDKYLDSNLRVHLASSLMYLPKQIHRKSCFENRMNFDANLPNDLPDLIHPNQSEVTATEFRQLDTTRAAAEMTAILRRFDSSVLNILEGRYMYEIDNVTNISVDGNLCGETRSTSSSLPIMKSQFTPFQPNCENVNDPLELNLGTVNSASATGSDDSSPGLRISNCDLKYPCELDYLFMFALWNLDNHDIFSDILKQDSDTNPEAVSFVLWFLTVILAQKHHLHRRVSSALTVKHSFVKEEMRLVQMSQSEKRQRTEFNGMSIPLDDKSLVHYNDPQEFMTDDLSFSFTHAVLHPSFQNAYIFSLMPSFNAFEFDELVSRYMELNYHQLIQKQASSSALGIGSLAATLLLFLPWSDTAPDEEVLSYNVDKDLNSAPVLNPTATCRTTFTTSSVNSGDSDAGSSYQDTHSRFTSSRLHNLMLLCDKSFQKISFHQFILNFESSHSKSNGAIIRDIVNLKIPSLSNSLNDFQHAYTKFSENSRGKLAEKHATVQFYIDGMQNRVLNGTKKVEMCKTELGSLHAMLDELGRIKEKSSVMRIAEDQHLETVSQLRKGVSNSWNDFVHLSADLRCIQEDTITLRNKCALYRSSWIEVEYQIQHAPARRQDLEGMIKKKKNEKAQIDIQMGSIKESMLEEQNSLHQISNQRKECESHIEAVKVVTFALERWLKSSVHDEGNEGESCLNSIEDNDVTESLKLFWNRIPETAQRTAFEDLFFGYSTANNTDKIQIFKEYLLKVEEKIEEDVKSYQGESHHRNLRRLHESQTKMEQNMRALDMDMEKLSADTALESDIELLVVKSKALRLQVYECEQELQQMDDRYKEIESQLKHVEKQLNDEKGKIREVENHHRSAMSEHSKTMEQMEELKEKLTRSLDRQEVDMKSFLCGSACFDEDMMYLASNRFALEMSIVKNQTERSELKKKIQSCIEVLLSTQKQLDDFDDDILVPVIDRVHTYVGKKMDNSNLSL